MQRAYGQGSVDYEVRQRNPKLRKQVFFAVICVLCDGVFMLQRCGLNLSCKLRSRVKCTVLPPFFVAMI